MRISPDLSKRSEENYTLNPSEVSPAFSLALLSLDFFQKCLKTSTTQCSPTAESPAIIDRKKLTDIYKDFEPAFQQNSKHQKQLDEELEIPNIDWAGSARRGLHNAIEIIFKSGLVSRNTLVDASKFLGPGNINILPSQHYGMFHNLDYAVHLMEKDEFTLPIPIPKDRQTRNKYISLDIGTGVVLTVARGYLDVANNLGLKLSQLQAIELALLEITVHEYAHAINDAFSGEGEDTFERSKGLTREVLALSPENEQRAIHSELFARGIQEFVVKQYMLSYLDFSEQEANQFITSEHTQGSLFLEKVKTFVRVLRAEGFKLEDIYKMESALGKATVDLFGKEAKEFMPYIQKWFRYLEEPYREQEIRTMIGKTG